MKKYFYYISKFGKKVMIYWKLQEYPDLIFLVTEVEDLGNKRIGLRRILRKVKIVTRPIIDSFLLRNICIDWVKVNHEVEFIEYMRRGNPNSRALELLTQFFGNNIFELSSFERIFFKEKFKTVGELVKFYYKDGRRKKFVYHYKGSKIVMTPGKIRRGIKEVFCLDPKEVLYGKRKSQVASS